MDDPTVIGHLLRQGRITVTARLVDASNATLLAALDLDGRRGRCVYKPVAGERPLRDFPSGTLAHREVAAAVLDDALGWGLVPPTVLRDGPWGPGSVQWWIDPPTGPETTPRPVDLFALDAVPATWRSVLQGQDETGALVALAHSDDPDLRRLAIFDVLANNADRKAGHVLLDTTGRVRGVDHGLTFHAEPKLRTVLWGWAGLPLPDEDVPALRALVDRLRPGGAAATRLGELLHPTEVDQTLQRLTELLAAGRYPRPVPGTRAIPWPVV